MKRNRPWNWAAWSGVAVILVILVGIAYILLAGIVFDAGFSLESTTARAAVIAALASIGILRYLLRKSAGLFFYGLIQLSFGLVAAWLALDVAMTPSPDARSGAPPHLALLAILAVASYLICHGIGNFADGIRRPPGDLPPGTGGSEGA